MLLVLTLWAAPHRTAEAAGTTAEPRLIPIAAPAAHRLRPLSQGARRRAPWHLHPTPEATTPTKTALASRIKPGKGAHRSGSREGRGHRRGTGRGGGSGENKRTMFQPRLRSVSRVLGRAAWTGGRRQRSWGHAVDSQPRTVPGPVGDPSFNAHASRLRGRWRWRGHGHVPRGTWRRCR